MFYSKRIAQAFLAFSVLCATPLMTAWSVLEDKKSYGETPQEYRIAYINDYIERKELSPEEKKLIRYLIDDRSFDEKETPSLIKKSREMCVKNMGSLMKSGVALHDIPNHCDQQVLKNFGLVKKADHSKASSTEKNIIDAEELEKNKKRLLKLSPEAERVLSKLNKKDQDTFKEKLNKEKLSCFDKIVEELKEKYSNIKLIPIDLLISCNKDSEEKIIKEYSFINQLKNKMKSFFSSK